MKTPKTYYALAWRNGRITISARPHPDALTLIVGTRHRLRRLVDARSRHGYRRGVRLVPGIPEARDDEEALAAAIRFRDRLRDTNTDLHVNKNHR